MVNSKGWSKEKPWILVATDFRVYSECDYQFRVNAPATLRRRLTPLQILDIMDRYFCE